MPTYEIKAPDGQTYRVDGPAGATHAQVRDEVLRQYPTAGNAPGNPVQEFGRGVSGPRSLQPNEAETYPRAAGRALRNLPISTAETLKSIMMTPVELGKLAFTEEGRQQARTMYDDAAGILTGGLQRVREMSAPEHRGSAPAMDKAKFDAWVAKKRDEYSSGRKVASRVAENPAGTALAVAGIAQPALRAAGVRGGLVGAADRAAVAAAEKVGQTTAGAGRTVKKAVGTPVRAVQNVTTAERRGNAAAAEMQADAGAVFKGAQDEAEAATAAATARSERAAQLAERARERARTLDAERAQAAAAATPPTPDIGTSRHLSEMGDELRNPALAKQAELDTQMRAADEKLRSAMEAVAADRAAAGVGVSDSTIAKLVLRKSRSLVEPDPVKRPGVGSVPADSAGGKLHRELLDVLGPKEVPLTEVQARQAIKAGIKVNKAPDGTPTRTIKPDLKAVDDFRRKVGKVLDGSIEGYEAINRKEAQRMYADLGAVIDKYVSGASAPVQANWREGMAALEPFNSVRAGQNVVGMQNGTDVASVASANIPGRALAGGRDTMQQTATVSGAAPVAATARSQVQNAFLGAKTADEAAALVRPGTALGDVVNADPDLAASVSSYIERVRAAEANAARAADLEARAATNAGRAKALDKASEAAQAKALKAAEQTRLYEREVAALELADPEDVGRQYLSMLKRAHKENRVTKAQYKAGLKLAGRAKAAFKQKATRDQLIRQISWTLGLGALGTAGLGAINAAKD